MKISAVLISVMFLLLLAGCGSSPVDRVENMAFFGTEAPIGKMIESHPLVEPSSIRWSELDPQDGRSIVLCEFHFYNPTKQKIPVQITFAVGKKGGEIIQIQSLHPYDGGNHPCSNYGIFLKALEEKKDLNYAVLGYTKDQFEEMAKYNKEYSIYFQKMYDAEHPGLSEKEIADLKKFQVGYTDPYGRQINAGTSLGEIIEALPNKLVEGTQQRLVLDVKRGRSKITLIVIGAEGEKIHLFFDIVGDEAALATGFQFRGERGNSMGEMMLLETLFSLKDADSEQQAMRIRAEIKNLDAKQQEQLVLVDQGVDQVLDILRADIKMWKQEQTKLKNREKELREKIGPVLSERVEIKIGFDDKIRTLRTAKDDFEKFKTNSLSAGAKLINDAIIAEGLEVDLLARNGMFRIDPIIQMRSGKVGDAQADVGLAPEYRWTVFANASEELVSFRSSLLDITSVTIMETVNGKRVFFHFPRQIEDESVRKAFLQLYQVFDERLRQEGNWGTGQYIEDITFKGKKDDLRRQQISVLEKFDYKNEGHVVGYREPYRVLLSKFKNEMDELAGLKTQQADVVSKIAKKEAILNMPKTDLPQALRQEIKQIFAEKRQSLEASLAALKR